MKTCNRPDRDVAALVCGYPFPCPHHKEALDEELPTIEEMSGSIKDYYPKREEGS